MSEVGKDTYRAPECIVPRRSKAMVSRSDLAFQVFFWRSSSEFRIFWGDCPDQCGSWRRHHASRIGWTWWPLPGLVIVDLCWSLVYRCFFNFEQMPSEFCQLRNLFPASVPENRHSTWNALKLCSLWDATQNGSIIFETFPNHFLGAWEYLGILGNEASHARFVCPKAQSVVLTLGLWMDNEFPHVSTCFDTPRALEPTPRSDVPSGSLGFHPQKYGRL
jgi:hypothetical protein